MRVGDLVKVVDNASMFMPISQWNLNLIGVVTELGDSDWYGPHASVCVQWLGNTDWDIEYIKNLEVISNVK